MKLFKNLVVGTLGTLLVGGLLFGSNVVPYAQTAYQKLSDSAQDAVPISFQIDAAKQQLAKIRPEVNNMYHQIAKEKVQVKRLEQQIVTQKSELAKSQSEILALRQHLDSGKEFFIATNAKAYTSDRVKEDLRHRFTLHKTAKQRLQTAKKTLALRQASLNTAFESLERTQSQQRALQVNIETLNARACMNDLVKTTAHYDFDDSQLARTRAMVEDISARIETEEEMLNLAPVVFGQIPVNNDADRSAENLLNELDAYFKRSDDTQDSAPENQENEIRLDTELVSN